MSRTRLALLAIGLALSAAAVAVLVRSIDLGEALAVLRTASPVWVLAGCAVTTLGYFFRALRWREVLSRRDVTVGHLFSATMVGFLAINLVPARLGEFVRAYALARSERIPAALVLGSVAVERVLDLVALGIFWALSLLFAPLPEWFRMSGYLTIGLAVVVWVVLRRLLRAGERGFSAKGALFAWMPERARVALTSAMPAFGAGLQTFGDRALLARAACWSVLIWMAGGAIFLLVGESMGMRLPLWSGFLLPFIISMGILIPSSPGFIGVLEGACVIGLKLLGFEGPQALAFGILYHLVQLVPVLVLGGYFAVREHLLPLVTGSGAEDRGGEERKD